MQSEESMWEDATSDGSELDGVLCVRCSCVIGDEVGYGDDLGDGPICSNCLEGMDQCAIA